MDLQRIVNFGPRSELYSRTRSAAKRIHPVISEAYGDYEQHTGFMTALEEQFAFPFSAKVLGETLQVTGMEWPQGDEFGLDLVVERNGEAHRTDASSVELVAPFPDGPLTLAAYLKWRRFV